MSAEIPATRDANQEVSLPANRSFVLQFRAGSGAEPTERCAGRIEHVVSGRSARFEDWAALQDFIAQALRELGR